MRLGLLGDVHGNLPWMRYAIDRFQREGIAEILQVGDFGIFGTDPEFLATTERELARRDMTVYVTPGNHEDYTYIRSAEQAQPEDGWVALRPHIQLARRGFRWQRGGLAFVSLGGAPSVDRTWRQKIEASGGEQQWWVEEAITAADVAATIAGGRADVMICHDAPHGVYEISRGIAGNPHGFPDQDLLYARVGRDLLTEAVAAVRPSLLFHGHYHFPVDEEIELADGTVTRIVGLDRDTHGFALGELDTEIRAFTHWEDTGAEFSALRRAWRRQHWDTHAPGQR